MMVIVIKTFYSFKCSSDIIQVKRLLIPTNTIKQTTQTKQHRLVNQTKQKQTNPDYNTHRNKTPA